MFIKEIKLCGFKSYKNETVVSELFNGLNIIVGRNGSGKSNIFSAIEFALTLEYNKSLKPEARNTLVFQDRKTQDPVFVEIVFDNSDRKLPVDDDTVIFKRVVNSKIDRFYVNNKQLSNVKQFLDAAGFTSPYFIVKQGKIHDLALATNATRLKVISDVTGDSAFDSKINECRRNIAATEAKKKEIETKLAELKLRKDSLEEEVAEQREFKKRDQAKRAIEFTLHERKVQEIQENITNLETARMESNSRQKPIRKELESVTRDMQIYKRDVAELETNIKQLQDMRSDYEVSKNKMTVDLACHNQELEDLKNKEVNNARDVNTLSEIVENISEYLSLLKKVESDLSLLKTQKENLFFEKCQLDSRVDQFREKDLLKETSNTKSDRRGNVHKQEKEAAKNLAENRESLEQYITVKEELETQLQQEAKTLHDLRTSFSDLNNQFNEINQRIEKNRSIEHTLRSRLEDVWRQSSENDQILAQKRDRLARIDEEWKHCVGQGMFHGCKGVEKILDDFKSAGTHQNVINGYYGVVAEILECSSSLDRAIEAAAGKKLVHHVVQSSDVAEAILNEFNARKMQGEINFIPINNMKSRNVAIVNNPDGTELLVKLIQFPDKFSPVADFVFGSTLLCKSFEIATETMRQHKRQCVTLNGNKVSKVGVMTGGYISLKPQKLELQRTKRLEGKEVSALNDTKRNLDQESGNLKQEHYNCKLAIEKYYLQKSQVEEKRRRVLSDVETEEKKVFTRKEAIKSVDKQIIDIKAAITILEEKEKMLKGGAGSSDDKIQAVKSLRAITSQYSEAEKEYNAKLGERNELDTRLKQFRKRYYSIMESCSANNGVENQNDVTQKSEIIKSLKAQTAEIQKKIDSRNREWSNLQNKITTKQRKIAELSEKETRLNNQLRPILSEFDTFVANRAHLQNMLHDQKAEGNKLHSVPENMQRFEKLPTKELYKKLKKLNSKLKDSVKVGVNQKAIQQYEELNENCKSFDKRMNEFMEEEKKLAELLDDVVDKRGEAMLRNLRLLQEQFREFFCTIVPQGNAKLVFYGQNVSLDNRTNLEDIELRATAGANAFEGVQVLVNFVGKQLPNIQGLAQLSGGQKSVVALCLILAIQTLDPAPFYVFDEVDQALDTNHRDAVAKLIGEMSERSQFICTTFRKEFIDVADKIFGVSFDNRCSHISTITERQALNFVEKDHSPLTVDSQFQSFSPNGSFYNSDSTA